MIVMLRLGRWRCRHPGCERWIFTVSVQLTASLISCGEPEFGG
jgi:hypothetical protein